MLDCISKLSTGRFLVTALILYKRGRGKSNSNSNKTTYNVTAVADVMESINVFITTNHDIHRQDTAKDIITVDFYRCSM